MHRVSIVYPRANLDTIPSLVNTADLLAQHGYAVDVLTYSNPATPPARFDSPNVRVRSLGVEGLTTPALGGALRRGGWLRRVARAPLARGYRVLGAGIARGSQAVARARTLVPRPGAARQLCVIGVDPDGLVLAHSLARGAPVAYYSLELLLSYELRTAADARLKADERRLSRQAAFVIVQDEQRGKLLADDNDIPWDRVVLVPNAPAGPARRKRSDYWHARLGLAPDQRVVLHAGSLGDWTGIEDILESVPHWPASWVLVVHTRYDAESSPYVERLRARATHGRVFFSLKPVSRQDYDELVDGADVGLAFYVPTGDSSFTQRNIQTIGLSSGKLAYYLRAGLPVVVNAAASVAPLLEGDGSGISVAGADDIPRALARVEAAYAQYSQGACAFFERHLDFGRGFAEVIRRIDHLGNATAP
jgi:hypothetical protein